MNKCSYVNVDKIVDKYVDKCECMFVSAFNQLTNRVKDERRGAPCVVSRSI